MGAETPSTTQPPAGAPGAGPSAEEKKAATGAVLTGFLLGGPLGGVVMALAIGIEQAFGKSGWNQPGWLGGDRPPALTPEEMRQRHDEAVRLAQEYVAGARREAELRRLKARQHRHEMRDWVESGREGPKPGRPDRRGVGEFLDDFLVGFVARYRLFDNAMAKGNEKITGTYPKIGEFFRGLWNFVTGFAEGFQSELKRQRDERARNRAEDEADPAGGPQAQPDGKAPRPEPEPERPRPEPERGPEPQKDSEPPSPPPLPQPEEPPGGDHRPAGGGVPEVNSGPSGQGDGTAEGERMDTDEAAKVSTELPAAQAPQGETNLDLLLQAFRPAKPVLDEVPGMVDLLQARSAAITARIERISDLCQRAGAPIVVTQMVNQGAQLAVEGDRALANLNTHNEVARELTDEALIGLEPAQDDLDTTRREQASGDIYNRYGS